MSEAQSYLSNYNGIFKTKNQQQALNLMRRFVVFDQTMKLRQKLQNKFITQKVKPSTIRFTGGFAQKPLRFNFQKASSKANKFLLKPNPMSNLEMSAILSHKETARSFPKPQLPELISPMRAVSQDHSQKKIFSEKTMKDCQQLLSRINHLKSQSQTITPMNYQINQISKPSIVMKKILRPVRTFQKKLQTQASSILTSTTPSDILQRKNSQYKYKSCFKSLSPKKQLQKGYMIYDKQGTAFWRQNFTNVKLQPLIKRQIPGVSSQHYMVIDRNRMTVIAEKKSRHSIQIASLTKIMTCYLCILVCIKYQIDIKTFSVRVSDNAANMPGTSAQLQAGDIISIYQLLLGLMLPSGNDASVAIAENMGKVIQKFKKKQTKKEPYETFISHMNILVRQLNIQQEFQNSSGLSNNPNESTTEAICMLTALALRNSTFYEIVNTLQFETEIKNERYGLSRKIKWKNTNKLLQKKWQGVKTGTTQTAGHCLMAAKDDYIICVCDCETLSKRFIDCEKIYQKIKKAEPTLAKKIQKTDHN